MPLKTRLLLVIASLTGCGPETATSDWILGEHSSPSGNRRAADIGTRYAFEEDGRLNLTYLSACGGSEEHYEFVWRALDDGAVEVLPEPKPEGFGASPYPIRLERESCNRTIGTQFIDGEEWSAWVLNRGRVCFESGPACPDPGVECDTCFAVWCEGHEPPECE